MVLDVQLGRLDRDATRNAREDPGALPELVREEERRHPAVGPEFRREGPAQSTDPEDRDPHRPDPGLIVAFSLFVAVRGRRFVWKW